MNVEEWNRYESAIYPEPTIRGDEFVPPTREQGVRLLCRGYHLNGGSNLRVWLRHDSQIGVQENDGDIYWAREWETYALRPSKRAYREDTDLHFALLMRERHEYPLTFTSWRN